MKIKSTSYFKNPKSDREWFSQWVNRLENLNKKKYIQTTLITSLGDTHVYSLGNLNSRKNIVIFPGARTTSLIWDFDNGLYPLESEFKIHLIETNGLPNLSDGNTPDIKLNGYGEWAAEVLDLLNIEKAIVAGASFGGQICLKLSIVAPEKVQAAFLLNPGCLQPFSLSIKNLYYNLLPILMPNKRNISAFLGKAIFYKPHHSLSPKAETLLIDYELFALTRYKDNSQKPYYMKDELQLVTNDIFLIVGDKDLLFPYKKSIENAEKIKSLREVKIMTNVGHGIETYPEAIDFILTTAKNYDVPERINENVNNRIPNTPVL